MKIIKFVAISTVIVFSLSACNKQEVGSVGGALVGGVVGSQFGGGVGKAAATIGGAIVGGAVGNQVGKSMDNE